MTRCAVRTEYHYAPDGTRLWKVEQTGTPNETTTVTIGPIEIRNYQYGGLHTGADVLVTPHGNVRRAMDGTYSYLHKDQLGSVRAITDDTGALAKQSIYKPFGTVTDWTLSAGLTPETKGFIGERYDADAGLQYLNARYYDPELGIFIQPDWFEVTKAGVGTNRYSYAGNDPVNLKDDAGNAYEWALFWNAPYTLVNGIRVHNLFKSEGVTRSLEFSSETSIFNQAGARNGGHIRTKRAVQDAYNGVPDASRRLGSSTIEFFDYKPATRMENPELYQADLRQQKRWIDTGAERGVNMVPVDTRLLVPEEGLRTRIQFEGSDGPVYNVTLFPSDRAGIMLYRLDDTHSQRSNLENVTRSADRGLSRFWASLFGSGRHSRNEQDD